MKPLIAPAFCLSLILVFACSAPAAAQVTWDGGGDGSSWNDPANWNPDGVPMSGDDIDLTNAPLNLTIPASATGRMLNMTSGNTTLSGGTTLTLTGNASNALTMNGGSLTLDGAHISSQANKVNIGDTGTGSLFTIEGGGTLHSASANIGNVGGSSGTATVTGTNSTWTNDGNMNVGRNGTGILNIENGGFVDTQNFGLIARHAGANGTVNVDGTNSRWDMGLDLIVGREGLGTLNVTNGGNVSSRGGVIGQFYQVTPLNNLATINGEGSNWDMTSNLLVGGSGKGTLNVDAGGKVKSVTGIVGDTSTGEGTVNVTGMDGLGVASWWENTAQLNVAFNGTGSLNVSDGGRVSSTDGNIGTNSGAMGDVTVGGGTGVSRWDVTGGLYIGGNNSAAGGTGVLDIDTDGLVDVATQTKLWSGGSLNLNGGTLTTGSFDNSAGGSFDFSEGTLIVNGASGIFDPGVANYDLSTKDPTLLQLDNGASANFTGDLTIGLASELNLNSGSLVTVGGQTRLEGFGDVNINTGNLSVSGMTQSSGMNTASLVISGSDVSIANATEIGNGGVLDLNSGSLTTTQAEVSGTGALNINSGDLSVSGTTQSVGMNTGSLSISGGDVTVANTTEIGSGGVLTLDGGGSLTTGSFDNTAGGTFDFLEGALIVNSWTFDPGTTDFTLDPNQGEGDVVLDLQNGATADFTGTFSVGDLGTLKLNGGQLTAGSFSSENGQFEFNEGTLTVNGSSGVLALDGNYTLDGTTGLARLNLENGASASTSSLNIGVNGELNLNGGMVDVANTTEIGTGGTLNLNGGSLTTNAFDNSAGGGFNFLSGTLETTSSSQDLTVTSNNFQLSNVINTTFNTSSGITTLGAGQHILVAGNTTVEDSGAGSILQINSGGSLTNDSVGTIGASASSTGAATVTGPGSQWINWNDLYVGQSGNGTLNVDSGGAVLSSIGYLGFDSGGNGTATISGSGSRWISNLFVGRHGTGTLNVGSGGVVSGNHQGYLGYYFGSIGTATIAGSGSQWNSQVLYVGNDGTGTLNVETGGVVTNTTGWVGYFAGGNGAATISGSGSQWNTYSLVVGARGTGTLNIDSGGAVTSSNGHLGFESGGNGTATISGNGSQWTNSNDLRVGESSSGTLNVHSGGVVANSAGYLGFNSGSSGIATISGSGSQWSNSNELRVGQSGSGTLNVDSGGVVTSAAGRLGVLSGSSGTATISGNGSQWNSNDLLVGEIGTGTLNVYSGGVVTNGFGYLGFGSGIGTATISGNGSRWNNSYELFVGQIGTGTLNVDSGGVVTNSDGHLGYNLGSSGTASISGSGSQWNNSNDLLIGESGTGALNVNSGGVVTNSKGYLGSEFGSNGTATVSGSGSQWNNSSNLYVGNDGTGTLNVDSGGAVTNIDGILGFNSGSSGTATIAGSGSQWNNSGDLTVGTTGTGAVNINNNGLVTVGGTTSVNSTSSVTMGGGRFEFGTSDLSSFGRIGGTSGSLKGDVDMSGIHNVASLTTFQNTNLDMSEVYAINNGILYGSAFLGSALVNQSTGELRTFGSDFVRFAGTGNTNAGQINNFGGFTEFANDMTNQSGGTIDNFGGVVSFGSMDNQAGATINGRGQFIANGGWTNDGDMLFSGGFADVRGQLTNQAGGRIVTAGNSITTFFDNVDVESGSEVIVDTGSGLVFLADLDVASGVMIGEVGSSVFVAGELTIGNSPGTVGFGGDLTMGSDADTLIELGGLDDEDFDRLEIGGDARLNGELSVAMWNGFALGESMEFVFASITGDLTGMFRNLGEGDRVGTYNGYDLFISYQGGDGNDVALFSGPSPVPEPATVIMFATAIGMLACPRRRRS